MFYPQEMTKIELIVPERDVLAVTRVLFDQGIFHEVDTSYIGPTNELRTANDWREKSKAYEALERRVLSLMEVLDVEEGSPPPSEQLLMMDVEQVQSTVERLEQAIQDITDELTENQTKVRQIQSYIQQLERVTAVNVDIGAFGNARYVFAILGIIPSDHIERLETSLERIPFVLLVLHKESGRAIVLLLGTRRDADVLERAARSAYLNPLNLPDSYRGTPSQIIRALYADIAGIERYIYEKKEVMVALRQTHQQELQTLLWRVRTSRTLADAIAWFGRLRYTYVIAGWVPSVHLDTLTRQLKRASKEVLIETNSIRRGQTGQDVPVALKNPGIFRAFQQLVTAYGQPRYEELDPTFLITLTFPLLFGAMFGDVGHGLVLALLGGVLASRKIPSLRGLKDLGTVVGICGVVAMVFGFLYGSIFGFEEALPALWLRPMENMMEILGIAIGMGVVLLSVGFLIGILNAWITRGWSRLLVSHNGVAGLVLYWSLLGLAAKAFWPQFPIPPTVFVIPAVVSGAAVTFAEVLGHLIEGRRPLIEGDIATYAVQAFFELFETLISLLSNSLSYVRVGAFAVAHGGLSAVIFILAEMVNPARGVGYWVVVVLGNLFIIGFEGFIVGIQTLRLEYYEFFSKFFTGGGIGYVPLTQANE